MAGKSVYRLIFLLPSPRLELGTPPVTPCYDVNSKIYSDLFPVSRLRILRSLFKRQLSNFHQHPLFSSREGTSFCVRVSAMKWNLKARKILN